MLIKHIEMKLNTSFQMFIRVVKAKKPGALEENRKT